MTCQAASSSKITLDIHPSPLVRQDDVVLCVDAGGTKTLAVAVTSRSKREYVGQAGCGNCATLGLEQASLVILKAVKEALAASGYGTSLDLIKAGEAEGITTPPLSVSENDVYNSESEVEASTSVISRPRVRAIWIGSAGLSSSNVIRSYRQLILQVFQDNWLADDKTQIWVTNDAVLLSAPMLGDPYAQSCVCLIAGTGSAGFAFQRTHQNTLTSASPRDAHAADITAAGENEEIPGLVTVSKTGGWGYLLGDRGSGWSIGLSTIQLLLTREEGRQFSSIPLTDFEKDACQGLGVSSPIELIHAAYRDRVCASGGNFFHAEDARKRWLAEITRVVFDYAFNDTGRTGKEIATCLLHQAIDECIESISKLCNPSDRIRPNTSTLVLGGGLWSNTRFQQLLVTRWRDCGKEAFKKVHMVKAPAHEAVNHLAQTFL